MEEKDGKSAAMMDFREMGQIMNACCPFTSCPSTLRDAAGVSTPITGLEGGGACCSGALS